MPINSDVNYQELLSLTLEERSAGYQDLVSNSNILLKTLKEKGLWKQYSGPRIRERLVYQKTGSGLFYTGYGYLNPVATELINDAYWIPKQAATSVVLSNTEILNNSGENQIADIMETHIDMAERELMDLVDAGLHSDGTGFGGLQFTGLLAALPTTTSTGTYGGIDRATAVIWRPYSYDVNSYFAGITQVTSATIRSILNQASTLRSRGRNGPDLVIMSTEHYQAFDAATTAIQRINDVNGMGKYGFSSLKYYGAGRQMDIVLEGGIGSNMPSNVSYLINTDSFRFRYHPERNFTKIGKAMMPVNQDAIVQHIGIMGELTMVNPLHNAKIYDSNPAA